MKLNMMLLGALLLAFGCAQKPMADTAKKSDLLKAVAEAYYMAYNKADVEGQTKLMTDDMIYHSNSDKIRVGKDAYHKYTVGLFKEIDEKCIDIKYFVDEAQGVVTAQSRVEGKYVTSSEGLPKAKGQKYNIPVVEVFEIKDGKIKKLTTYYNEDLWKTQISKKQ